MTNRGSWMRDHRADTEAQFTNTQAGEGTPRRGRVQHRISRWMTAVALLFAVSMAVVPGAARAQFSLEADTVGSIAVQGSQRIEPATVRTYMAIREGDAFDPVLIDRSLKNLFATGLFADVSMNRQGDVLVVRVVENPIINRITFEGNKRVKDEDIGEEVTLRPRVVYTRSRVQRDVKAILDLYRRKGRFAVSVEPNVIELPENRIDLVFEINEGPPTYVRKISFVGNTAYSDGELRDEVLTEEESWWNFLTSNDTYDPDRMKYDAELLRQHYTSEGYADFEVLSSVAELSPERESFFLTFTVSEGIRYRFGNLDVVVEIPDLEIDGLTDFIEAEQGEWFDGKMIEDTILALTDELGRLGYAFTDVKPRLSRNQEDQTIDITWVVEESPRVFVNRIKVKGNVRTLDEVIRREMLLVEGDAFNSARMRRSSQRVKNLGFFKEAEIENVPSEAAPDRTDIEVTVEEQPTGELSFGIGFSSTAGALFDMGVRERNLLGKGQDLRFNLSIAEYRNQIDIGFTEPYFMDRRVAAGFDLFAVETDYYDEANYRSTNYGGNLRMAYAYNEYLVHRWSYKLNWTKLEIGNTYSSLYLREQVGTTVQSSISHVLTYDKRDSYLEPTEGFFVSLSNELAGLGGNERFLRSNVSGGWYYQPMRNWILGISGTVGYIFGISDDIRIFQRYQLGGDNLRGFDDFGVSPRILDSDFPTASSTRQAVGGDWIATARAELEIPLGLPEEMGLTVKAFTDWGMIGKPGDITLDPDGTESLLYSSSPRGSVGIGVIWEAPVGPIRIDFGKAVKKQPYDDTQTLRVNFGQQF